MKVKQLIKELQNCDLEDEVVIPVTSLRNLGAEPSIKASIKVSFIPRGFEWDDEKVFIRPPGSVKLSTS